MTTPTLYIPHGGGPCFFMDWTWGPADTWDKTAAWLKSLAADLPGGLPKAIVVVSGHWEAPAFTVTGSAAPSLIYDYHGFPKHTYELTYPAPGAPALAQKIAKLLGDAGLPAAVDPTRGLDHGVFVPFKLIYPDAQIPVVQLSLHASLDPALHLAAGRALASLREEGVLIVASGMSYHNMRGFGGSKTALGHSEAFDAWLSAASIAAPSERAAQLAAWEAAPSARASHPREEHLIPLHVAVGAADGEPGAKIFSDVVMGVRVSAFRFG